MMEAELLSPKNNAREMFSLHLIYELCPTCMPRVSSGMSSTESMADYIVEVGLDLW